MRVIDLLLTRFNHENFKVISHSAMKIEENKINKDPTNINFVKSICEIHDSSTYYDLESPSKLHIALPSQTALNSINFQNKQESQNDISMHEEQFSESLKDDWHFATDSEEDSRLQEERWWNIEEIRLFEEIEPLGSAFMTPPESPIKQPPTVFEPPAISKNSTTTDSPEIKKLLLSKPHKNYEGQTSTTQQTRGPSKRKETQLSDRHLTKKPTIAPARSDAKFQADMHQPSKHSKDHNHCGKKQLGLPYIDDSFIIKCLLNPNLNDEVQDETNVLREISRGVMSSIDRKYTEEHSKSYLKS